MTEKEAKELLQQAIELYEQRDLDNAIEILRKIQYEYSPKQYARAQFILGLSLGKKGDSKGEVSAYRNIKREYSLEWYAKAQVNIGFVLAEQGNIDDAIKTYDGIERGYNTSAYAMAQFNLGTTLLEKKIDEGKCLNEECKKTLEDAKDLYNKSSITKEEMLNMIARINRLLNKNETIVNPKTGVATYLFILILIIIISVVLFKRKKNYIR